MVDIIPEKATRTITISFKDPDGNPATPTSVDFKIIDPFTGTKLREDTIHPTSPEYQIQLTSQDNRILNSKGYDETRIITITQHYNLDDVETVEFTYKIENLKGIEVIEP